MPEREFFPSFFKYEQAKLCQRRAVRKLNVPHTGRAGQIEPGRAATLLDEDNKS
jgi:hypothetical protein